MRTANDSRYAALNGAVGRLAAHLKSASVDEFAVVVINVPGREQPFIVVKIGHCSRCPATFGGSFSCAATPPFISWHKVVEHVPVPFTHRGTVPGSLNGGWHQNQVTGKISRHASPLALGGGGNQCGDGVPRPRVRCRQNDYAVCTASAIACRFVIQQARVSRAWDTSKFGGRNRDA